MKLIGWPGLGQGRAKMSALTRKREQILVIAVATFYTGKAIFKNSTVQVTVDDLLDVGAKESILPLKPVLVDLLERFKKRNPIIPALLIIFEMAC